MNEDEMKVYEKGYADGQAHAIDTMNYILHDEGVKISKETARDILQIIKDEYEYVECISDLERIIAKKFGI